MGFFGYTCTPKRPPQPRWLRPVAPADAIAATTDVLEVWHAVARWPDAPPFSGGVYDWPARLRAGVEVCRAEAFAVREYLRNQEAAAHG